MSPKSFPCAVRGRAFLHFHGDAGDYYVDVKLDSRFQRNEGHQSQRPGSPPLTSERSAQVQRATRCLDSVAR